MKLYSKLFMNILAINDIQESSLTKAEKFVGGLKDGVSAQAGWCEHNLKLNIQWWRIWAHLNQCTIETINAISDINATVIGILAASPCSWACGIIAGIISIQKTWINWLNSRCGGDGVELTRIHNGVTYFWAVC